MATDVSKMLETMHDDELNPLTVIISSRPLKLMDSLQCSDLLRLAL